MSFRHLLVVILLLCSARSHDIRDEHRETFEIGRLVIGGESFRDRHDFIESGGRCGNAGPSDADRERIAQIVKKYNNQVRRAATTTVAVETWFHVITSSKGVGYLSPSQLNQQLAVLNKAYASTGFSFRLAGVTCTKSDKWYARNITAADNQQMKTMLRRGKSATLNIFFKPLRGLLGYSSMPGWYYVKPWDDGVVVNPNSMPGGSAVPYNLGYTAVHEVGHWLGLFHPFEGNSCSGYGDHVADTPSQSTYTVGCPVSKDSCSLVAGKDSINNFMDYSDDSCLRQFTSGQANFMSAMWQQYRKMDYVFPQSNKAVTSISCVSR